MSTFYDPATIRRLAETGDQFYKGAAWILDQQDAAVEGANEQSRRIAVRHTDREQADLLARIKPDTSVVDDVFGSPHRAAFIGDRLTMDEARAAVQARYEAGPLDYESQRQH